MKVRFFVVATGLVGLTACAQLETSAAERAALQAAAAKAGDDYVSCVVDASDRFRQPGESVALTIEVSTKACTAARSAFGDADTALVKTQYMLYEPIVKKDQAALDERATQQVQDRVLAHKAGTPPVAAPASVAPAAVAPAVSASAASSPSDSSAYLTCMRTEGQRYAGVNEPAQVVAEVAHSHCSALLTDAALAAQLEKQGRALVMGMVLDRKASQP